VKIKCKDVTLSEMTSNGKYCKHVGHHGGAHVQFVFTSRPVTPIFCVLHFHHQWLIIIRNANYSDQVFSGDVLR